MVVEGGFGDFFFLLTGKKGQKSELEDEKLSHGGKGLSIGKHLMVDLRYVLLKINIFSAKMKRIPQQRLKYYFLLLPLMLLSISVFTSCSSAKKVKNQNINKVIDTAKSYRGTPYRYGGTTRSGIDCSALIFHAYGSVGVKMPRTSEEQSKMGKKVPEGKLEKGDLVFFATGRNKRKVSHSGIVTETSRGKVYFIHSSTSLGVTEDNLDMAYWKKAFLFGRRIL